MDVVEGSMPTAIWIFFMITLSIFWAGCLWYYVKYVKAMFKTNKE